MPLHVTTSVARRIERAEISFCALVASASEVGCDELEIGGGCAVYAGRRSPLSKVLGLGLDSPVTDGDLDTLESFYSRYGAAVQVELCPLAAADLPPRLSKRGYILQAFETELVRALDSWRAGDSMPAGDIRVDVATRGDADEWLDAVSRGFAAGQQPRDAKIDQDALNAVAQMMRLFLHPSLTRYTVRIGDLVAGGGALWIHDGVAGIFGTATDPEYRRRGVQTALVRRCLDEARGKAEIAIATTEPGSVSQRTFERLGFQVAYTRAILVR